MRTQNRYIIAICSTFHAVHLGTDIIQIGNYACLLSTWQYGTAVFALAMVSQYAMYNALDLPGVNLLLFQHILQFMRTDVYMTQQIHIRLGVSLPIIFIDLAVIMEKNCQDTALDLNLVGQTWIEPVQHVQHLVCMV